jgi:hypothetical protein
MWSSRETRGLRFSSRTAAVVFTTSEGLRPTLYGPGSRVEPEVEDRAVFTALGDDLAVRVW